MPCLSKSIGITTSTTSFYDSGSLYEINTVFLKSNSIFVYAPNFGGGIKFLINYADDPWTTGENDIMYDGWEILGHEMQHGTDFEDGVINFGSNEEHIRYAERRAVSFGNYLREAYGITSFRESYKKVGIEKGDKGLRQYKAKDNEKVSNFKALGGNKVGNSFGFSYKRGKKNQFMIISHDKNRTLNIKFYDDEDEYKNATEDW